MPESKKMDGLKRQPILNDCGNWCGVKNYCVKTVFIFTKHTRCIGSIL